jgi:hypothetical protein
VEVAKKNRHVQAGIVLSDFALTRLEKFQHFSNPGDNFGLTRFGADDSWRHLSLFGRWQKATPLSFRQSRMWVDCVVDTSTRLN